MLQQEEKQCLGTVFVLAGVFFGCLQAFIAQSEAVPRLMLAEVRTGLCAALAGVFLFFQDEALQSRWLRPSAITWLLLVRGLLFYSFLYSWWCALRQAPLGDCIAILYAAPILAAVWSRLAFGERLLRIFPLQVCLVVVGVVLITQPSVLREQLDGMLGETRRSPDLASSDVDYRCAAVAMVINSINPIATHQTRQCSWCEVMLVCSLMSCLLLNPLALYFEHLAFGSWPDVEPIGTSAAVVMLLGAACLFLNLSFEIKGYQLAKPGKAAMFVYMEVPFAYLLQCLRAQHALRLPAVIGSCLIIASSFIGTFAQLTNLEGPEDSAKDPLGGYEGFRMEGLEAGSDTEDAPFSPVRVSPLKDCPRTVSLQSAE